MSEEPPYEDMLPEELRAWEESGGLEWGSYGIRKDFERMELRFYEKHMINPSADKLAAEILKASNNELRGLLIRGGDLIWWDANDGTHGDAMTWLGLDLRDVEECELHVETIDPPAGFEPRPGGAIFFTARNRRALDLVLAHPSLGGNTLGGALLTPYPDDPQVRKRI